MRFTEAILNNFYRTLCVLAFYSGIFYPNDSKAQIEQYPFEIAGYNFINYDSNKINFYGNTANFTKFFGKLDTLTSRGEGQINVVSFGGSHIQADIFTGQLRKRFQLLNGGMNAGRGFVFPYRMANTNTPYGYYFRYTGKWESYRNINRNINYDLGMAGIMAYTSDSLSSVILMFEPNNRIKYDFNRVKIYHLCDSLSYSVQIDSLLVESIIEVPDEDYTEFYLKKYVDTLELFFVKTDSIQTGFQFYGMNLETEDPGIIYHNFGINGASTSSFVKCTHLEQQLKSIKPDMVIFGLGINDAYGKNFNQSLYQENYDTLIKIVKRINPDAAIVFTTNNDSYLYQRNVNGNGEIVRETINKIAIKHDVAVWDMYSIMGGLNSIVSWQNAGLAQRDKVHFTRPGYMLLADLFFDAMMQSFGNFLQWEVVNSEPEIKGELTKK